MAMRWMSNRIYSHEKDRKMMTLLLTGAGAAVPTFVAATTKGIASIAWTATGILDIQFGNIVNGITLPDLYTRFLGLSVTPSLVGTYTAASSVVNAYVVAANNAISTTGIMRIQLISGTGVAANLVASELLYLTFTFGDSSAV